MMKPEMFTAGIERMQAWCDANGIVAPKVTQSRYSEQFGTCAYYRDGEIVISIDACAAIGTGGRSRRWSYPGHYIDRTPYGVLQHELAHHVDKAHGAKGGIYGARWRTLTNEKPLTGYCPNDNEWFAEMFRLFVTNPTLLDMLRPATYLLMAGTWQSVETRHWEVVLNGATKQLIVIRKREAEQQRRLEGRTHVTARS